MKDFSSYGYMQGPLRAMVQEDLNKMGIHGTAPHKRRSKTHVNSVSNNQGECGIYGKPLPDLETRPVPGQAYIRVPRLLLRSCNFLSHHLQTEGLFRKSGSLARQKLIRTALNEGNSIGEDSNPHDVASLLKQFLRELPDPLLTHELYNSFVQSQTLELEEDQIQAVLLLVLCLPDINRHTLQFLMGFLHHVSEACGINKMTVSNLAVVIAPNIIRGSTSSSTMEGSNIKLETQLVESLIQNSSEIGLVPEDMSRRAHNMILELSGIWGVSQQEAAFKIPLKGKRKRSGSLSGILTSVFKQNKTLRSKHATSSSVSRPCTSSTLPRKSISNQDLSEAKTKSVPTINGDLSFSTPCIRTPISKPPTGTPLLSAQRRTALLRQTPVDPRKRPGKSNQQTLDCPSPVEFDPPTKRSKFDSSAELAAKRKNFKQRLSEGLSSRYRKSRLKKKRSRTHCSSESAVVANAVAMAIPATPCTDQDKRRKERTPVFCFKAKPGSFNDQDRRLAARLSIDSPVQPELIEYNPDSKECTPTVTMIGQKKKLFPSPRLDDTTEDLHTKTRIISPELSFKTEYNGETFALPRQSPRLLRRSAPVAGSNTQLSERTPVLRRSPRISGGFPLFGGLTERSVSGSSYTASKKHSVSLNTSTITPNTFSKSAPFSPIRVSLNLFAPPSQSNKAAIPPNPFGMLPTRLETSTTLIGALPSNPASPAKTSGNTPSLLNISSRTSSEPGCNGGSLEISTSQENSLHDDSLHDDSLHNDSLHDESCHDENFENDRYSNNSSQDALPDCTANLTELFTTRDITQLDVSLGVNELDRNFCIQLGAVSSDIGAVSRDIPTTQTGGQLDIPTGFTIEENQCSDFVPNDESHITHITQNISNVVPNDESHITHITQNMSSFMHATQSIDNTDTSRTDFPKFNNFSSIPHDIILKRTSETPILSDRHRILSDLNVHRGSQSMSSGYGGSLSTLQSSDHNAGSCGTLIGSSLTASGLLVPSSSVESVMKSPPRISRVMSAAVKSRERTASEMFDWIGSRISDGTTSRSSTSSFSNVLDCGMLSATSDESGISSSGYQVPSVPGTPLNIPSAPGTPLNIPEQQKTGSKHALVIRKRTTSLSGDSSSSLTRGDASSSISRGDVETRDDITRRSDVTLTTQKMDDRPYLQVVQDDQISSTVSESESPSKENLAPTSSRSEKRTPKSSTELDSTKINITPRTKISRGFTKNLASQWENMNRDDAGSVSRTMSTRKTRIPIRTLNRCNSGKRTTPLRMKPGGNCRNQADKSGKRPTLTRATSAKTSERPSRTLNRTKSENLGNITRPAWKF